MDPTFLILLLGAGVLFMFLMQRPVRKQAQAQAKMRDSLQPGTRVMLNSGLLGTVKHLAATQIVVELAPGVEVTVMKAAVNKMLDAADEEFEYDEDSAIEGVLDPDEYDQDEFDQDEVNQQSGEPPMNEDEFFSAGERIADEQSSPPTSEPHDADPERIEADSVTIESDLDDTQQRPGN